MALDQFKVSVVLFLLLISALMVAIAKQPEKWCSDTCGDVKVPYPFGMSEGCYLNQHFFINCNSTSYYPPKPFLSYSPINVTKISLEGQLHILKLIGRKCYNQSGGLDFYIQPWFTLSNFNINDTANKFVVVGCDSFGYVQGLSGDKWYTIGCMSICESTAVVNNGTCNGGGCCETSIPKDVSKINLTVGSFDNHTSVWGFNPCSYAFVVEEEQFRFTLENLTNLQNVEKLPMVLDWTIGNETCEMARKNLTSYACQDNAVCNDVEGHLGYRCSCKDGYEGNPDLVRGCKDVNECDNQNSCTDKQGCKNTDGNYTCSCPKGYYGEGRGENGCTRKSGHQQKVITIVASSAIAVAVLLFCISWLHFTLKSKNFIAMREKFFEENGGLILQQKLIRQGGNSTTAPRIYKEEELKEATNNFDESNKIGEGGFGRVYKGILGNEVIAVKKSKLLDHTNIDHRTQIDLFINELVVLSKINHKKAVKLLGCCLETEVPILVYEYIDNKTLSYHLHGDGRSEKTSLPWDTRLSIAAETAGVLSYLHSAASPPIIHRDIKPANILLDKNFSVKVSDFGASRLIPLDQTEVHSLVVQATKGYLDPEFLQTGQLTEQSDVYSFGVVLAELLTGRRAWCSDRPLEERNLANHFLSKIKEKSWLETFESSIVGEEHFEELKSVAMLAKRCLSMMWDDRPTMRDVELELEDLRKNSWRAQTERNTEEMESPLGNIQPDANECRTEITETHYWSSNISTHVREV
ncbi:hypothetical protein Pfo_017340 [Paulownia fortunei]|nr:hypothetical protein Pfo_017340 [Paulownia fortunei]